jgi:hypothetical protein
MNKKNSINYAEMGKITKQLKAGLKEKYKLLEDISKDFNEAQAIPASAPPLPPSAEFEVFLDKLDDFFNQGEISRDVKITGTLTVDNIILNDDLTVTSSSNISITKILEGAYGDRFAMGKSLMVEDIIKETDFDLEDQTIKDSDIQNCTLTGGSAESLLLINPLGLEDLFPNWIFNVESAYIDVFSIQTNRDYFDFFTKFGINGVTFSYKTKRDSYFRISFGEENDVFNFPFPEGKNYINSYIISEVQQVLFDPKGGYDSGYSKFYIKDMDLTVTRNVLVHGVTRISGNTIVQSSVSVGESTYIRDMLSVGGSVFLDDMVYVNQDITVTDDVFIQGQLFIGADMDEYEIFESNDDITVRNNIINKDVIYQSNNNGTITEVFRIDGLTTNNETTLRMNTDKKIEFQDEKAYIHRPQSDHLELNHIDGSILVQATEDIHDAIVIKATKGGIDIFADDSSAGQDIDIINTGGSINITATEDVPDAFTLTTTNGGMDITAADSVAGQDIDIKNEGGSINITATEDIKDAFTLTTTRGGIDITAADSSAGQDIDILNTGGSINITATEDVSDAFTLTTTNGGMDITAADSIAGQDIDILNTGGSINITATEDVSDAFTLTTTRGGIDITASDSSAGQDIDILNIGGSINLTATENVNDAITIITTTGGIDITAADSTAGQDIDIKNLGGSINLISTEDVTDAIVINTSNGGIDIIASNSSPGQDIDLINIGASINLRATEDVSDAITITTTTGGIDITALESTAGQDIDILNTGGSINITATEDVSDAFTLTTTNGGIDITAQDSIAGQDIDILNTGGSINLIATEDVTDAITITASTGGIDIKADNSTAGQDIDLINTGGSINLTSTEFINDAITLNATQGGIKLTAFKNEIGSVYIKSNGGIDESIIIHSDRGTSLKSINLLSDDGGIYLDSPNNITFKSNSKIDIDCSVIDLSTQQTFITLNNSVDSLNIDNNTVSIDALNNRVGINTTAPETDFHVIGSAIISGDLLVSGTTMTINTSVIVLEDPIITLGGENDLTFNDGKDRGVEFRYYDSSNKKGFFGFDETTGFMVYLTDITNTNEVISGTKGTFDIGTTFSENMAIGSGYFGLPNVPSNSLLLENRMGIGTTNPVLTIDIRNKTDGIRLPVGNVIQRPPVNGQPDSGVIRYNSEHHTFEGYGPGNNWVALGSVMDVDQDTYISAETYPNEDNDELRFYTLGDERMRILNNGNFGINETAPTEKLHVNGTIKIDGMLSVSTLTRIDGHTTLTDGITINGMTYARADGKSEDIIRTDGDGTLTFYDPGIFTQRDKLFYNSTYQSDIQLTNTRDLTYGNRIKYDRQYLSGIGNEVRTTLYLDRNKKKQLIIDQFKYIYFEIDLIFKSTDNLGKLFRIQGIIKTGDQRPLIKHNFAQDIEHDFSEFNEYSHSHTNINYEISVKSNYADPLSFDREYYTFELIGINKTGKYGHWLADTQFREISFSPNNNISFNLDYERLPDNISLNEFIMKNTGIGNVELFLNGKDQRFMIESEKLYFIEGSIQGKTSYYNKNLVHLSTFYGAFRKKYDYETLTYKLEKVIIFNTIFDENGWYTKAKFTEKTSSGDPDTFSILCNGDKIHSTRWVAFCKITMIDKTIFTRIKSEGIVTFDKTKIINEYSKSRIVLLKSKGSGARSLSIKGNIVYETIEIESGCSYFMHITTLGIADDNTGESEIRRNIIRIDRALSSDGAPTVTNYSSRKYTLSENLFTVDITVVITGGTYELNIKCNNKNNKNTNWVSKVEYIELKNQYSTNISNISYPVNKSGYIETTSPEIKVFPINSKITVDLDNGILNVDGDTNISTNLSVGGETHVGPITMSGHLLPSLDDTFDIGSAEYKIRDLYISDNSLWIGDSHKIQIIDGEMKFRKRKTNIVPSAILLANGTETSALIYSNKTSLDEMTIKDWENYSKTLDIGSRGIGNARMEDIFTENTEDYEKDFGTNAPTNLIGNGFIGDLKFSERELPVTTIEKHFSVGETDNEQSGFSVSLSNDGNIIAIGSIKNDAVNSDHLRIYQWYGTSWRQLGQAIDGEGLYNKSGYSVSLNNDGTIVAIGGGLEGNVKVYNYSGSNTTLFPGIIDTKDKFENIQSGDYIWMYLADGTLVAKMKNLLYDGGNQLFLKHDEAEDTSSAAIIWKDSMTFPGEVTSRSHLAAFRYYSNTNIWSSDGTTLLAVCKNLTYRDYYFSHDYGIGSEFILEGNVQNHGSFRWYNGEFLYNGFLLKQAFNAAGYSWPSYIPSNYQWRNYRSGGGESNFYVRNTSYTAIGPGLVFNKANLKLSVEYNGGIWPTSLSTENALVQYSNNNGLGGGEVGWYLRTQEKTLGTWTKLGSDISTISPINSDCGSSVSLSSDGTIVTIGGIYSSSVTGNTYCGKVRIYKYNNPNWEQLGTDISGESSGEFIGFSVDLSSDGTTVAISYSGYVRIYKYNNSNWTQQGSDINVTSIVDRFGYSVSLSSDGTIIAIGALGDNTQSSHRGGYVKIYKYNNSIWEQLGTDIEGLMFDEFGKIISLSSDGTIVSIGAYEVNYGGKVKMYQWDGSIWTKFGTDFYGEGIDYHGWNIVLSNDGSSVAIGSVYNSGSGNRSGHVRIFQISEILDQNELIYASISDKGRIKATEFIGDKLNASVVMSDVMKMKGITTTERDNLSTEAGTIIFNSTLSKHQAYNGTTWNDLY